MAGRSFFQIQLYDGRHCGRELGPRHDTVGSSGKFLYRLRKKDFRLRSDSLPEFPFPACSPCGPPLSVTTSAGLPPYPVPFGMITSLNGSPARPWLRWKDSICLSVTRKSTPPTLASPQWKKELWKRSGYFVKKVSR